jgi:hypothetical protein
MQPPVRASLQHEPSWMVWNIFFRKIGIVLQELGVYLTGTSA